MKLTQITKITHITKGVFGKRTQIPVGAITTKDGLDYIKTKGNLEYITTKN